jgi:energy-converting hydrogenase B subunit D
MMLEISLLMLVIISVVAVRSKDLVYAVILLAGADVALALGFYLLAAPDIALTQAAVVAGLMTFIFLIAINKTQRMEVSKPVSKGKVLTRRMKEVDK